MKRSRFFSFMLSFPAIHISFFQVQELNNSSWDRENFQMKIKTYNKGPICLYVVVPGGMVGGIGND